MHGCLRIIMVILALSLAIVIGLEIYLTVKDGRTLTGSEVFELAIYSCSFIICLLIIIELFKWSRR